MSSPAHTSPRDAVLERTRRIGNPRGCAILMHPAVAFRVAGTLQHRILSEQHQAGNRQAAQVMRTQVTLCRRRISRLGVQRTPFYVVTRASRGRAARAAVAAQALCAEVVLFVR